MYLLVAAWLAVAPPEPPGVAEVRDVYAACSALKQTASPLRYVELWYDRNRKSRWVPETQRDAGDVYGALALYSEGKVARFGVLEQTSPSGDWYLITEYCFRADGSLAFLFSTNTTPIGNVKDETRRYFDAKGKEIFTRRAVYDRDTGKPTSRTNFLIQEAAVFRTAKELLAMMAARP